jgi:alkylation response protein AidB-like acyl-CoA dehydrogenase
MNLDFTEEQLMLREAARDFLVKKFPKKTVRQLEESETGFSPEIWKEMADLGWTGLVIPEKYGGAGMTFLDLAVLLEEMGRACLPGPFFSTVVLGALPLLDSGNEAQKQQYLPRIARGELIFTLALTEDNARYDAGGIRVNAIKDRDEYVINGVKLFVPDAHVADYIICVARTASGYVPEDGISMFILDAKTPGIKCTLLKTIANDKLCEVMLENVRVPEENILGELNNAWSQVQKIIERAAAAKCCDMSGSLQQVFEMTLSYAKERIAFGQPIGSFQAVQHHCANMAIDVNGTMLSAYQAAWKISEGLPCGWEVAVAKAWASAACPRVIALAHQIHGAIGTTMDHDLHYYTRRTKAAESAFGDADFYQWKVAREISREE